MTVIAMTADSDGAVKCVYDDIELPTPQLRSVLGTDVGGQVGAIPAGAGVDAAFDVIAGAPPLDANGDPIGAVIVSSGTMTLPDGGEIAVPPPGAVLLDADDARPGTPEECAALKPTSVMPPLLTAP